MTVFRKIILICFASLCHSVLPAQLLLPGFTGYASPAEAANEEGESVLFSEKAGLHNWTNPQQKILYFFNATAGGSLTVSLWAKNSRAGTRLQVSIAGKKFTVPVPQTRLFKKIPAGTVKNISPGFYSITVAVLSTPGTPIADIQAVELGGKAAAGVQFNAKPRRNAASVHLRYPLPDTAKAISFYDEVTVPAGADQLYTYYMACGFTRGYFGIQVNSPAERRIIFSVWDAGNEGVDRNRVPEEKKVQLLAKGAGVVAEGFGNEGTGGHSHLVYNWRAGETYKFFVTALPDSAAKTTIYTGYFFMPELQKWKLIASFRAPEDGRYMDHLYSFVEDFDGVNGQLQRRAFFGNQWVRMENNQWNELTTATFSYDATGKAGDRTDYSGGSEDNKFYLWNGGFQPGSAKYGDAFFRKAMRQSPVIDLYKNADSAAQAVIDYKLMVDLIANGKLDTTGSVNGVYYKMLKEGTGRQVLVTDTVTAYYKGSLLNGEVFDQTKEKPASFPLSRLIKGWQIGLPLCRVGGKIQLIIPSSLGYSIRSRSSKIPPNSVLVFEIEVVDAR